MDFISKVVMANEISGKTVGGSMEIPDLDTGALDFLFLMLYDLQTIPKENLLEYRVNVEKIKDFYKRKDSEGNQYGFQKFLFTGNSQQSLDQEIRRIIIDLGEEPKGIGLLYDSMYPNGRYLGRSRGKKREVWLTSDGVKIMRTLTFFKIYKDDLKGHLKGALTTMKDNKVILDYSFPEGQQLYSNTNLHYHASITFNNGRDTAFIRIEDTFAKPSDKLTAFVDKINANTAPNFIERHLFLRHFLEEINPVKSIPLSLGMIGKPSTGDASRPPLLIMFTGGDPSLHQKFIKKLETLATRGRGTFDSIMNLISLLKEKRIFLSYAADLPRVREEPVNALQQDLRRIFREI